MAFRMADFASFMASVAHAEGWGDAANAMLAELQERQAQQSLGADRLVGVIRELFAESPAHAKEWAKLLLSLVPAHDGEIRRQLTSKHLIPALQHSKVLVDIFRISQRWNGYHKVQLFRIRAEEGFLVEGELAGAESEGENLSLEVVA